MCDLFPDIKEMKGWKKIEEKKSPFFLKVEEYEEWGFYRKKISSNAHFFLWLLRRAIHNFDLNIVWHFLHLCSMLRSKTMPDGWNFFLFFCINDACMINVSPDHCKLVTDRGILGSRRSRMQNSVFQDINSKSSSSCLTPRCELFVCWSAC